MTKLLVGILVASSAFAEAPFACNLKAFKPEERKEWRRLIEQVTSSVTAMRELPDGYALTIDSRKSSLVDVAKWIDLERKCCPFFDFDLDLHGEDGTLSLTLKGRDGVKQFIVEDFSLLTKRFPNIKRP